MRSARPKKKKRGTGLTGRYHLHAGKEEEDRGDSVNKAREKRKMILFLSPQYSGEMKEKGMEGSRGRERESSSLKYRKGKGRHFIGEKEWNTPRRKRERKNKKLVDAT